jgi:fumarate hydratase class II
MPTNTRGDGKFRVEEDALGHVDVRADHLWGAQTERSPRNFPIGAERYRWSRPVIRALVVLKKCVAQANGELGQLPREKVERVIAPARRERAASPSCSWRREAGSRIRRGLRLPRNGLWR